MMNVLAINSGSSSLKFKIVEFDESQKTAARFTANSHYEGLIEDIGQAAKLTLRFAGNTVIQSTSTVSTHTEAVRCMVQMLEESSQREGRPLHIDVVGHRVVHGGEQFREAVVIDNDVVAAIDRLAEFAPLHNPGAVAGIEGACAALGSHIPMVAVFDTALHRSIPARASTYALVFGGGIGERSAVIRARICEGMGWAGIRLDLGRNEKAVDLAPGDAMQISEEDAPVACYVAGVDEEVEIARATFDCIRNRPPSSFVKCEA